MIRGAKGESIEEPEDLDKELALLEGKLRKFGEKLIKRNTEVLLELYDTSIKPLLQNLLEVYNKFDRFYIETDLFIGLGRNRKNPSSQWKNVLTTAKNLDDLRFIINKADLENNPLVMISHKYKGINRDGLNKKEYNSNINIDFNELDYRIFEFSNDKVNSHFTKKYSEKISKEEIHKIARENAKKHKEFLEKEFSSIQDE
ncbi:MAG: hypothetical protein M3033_03890 [Acidobacteriota bacterium]|nr:hypothetical protein [Acidobacteriota bacterium]